MIETPVRLCGKCGAPSRSRDARCRVCNTPFPEIDAEPIPNPEPDVERVRPVERGLEEDAWGDAALEPGYKPRNARRPRVAGSPATVPASASAAVADGPSRRAFLRIGFLKSLILFTALAAFGGYFMAKWSVGHRDPIHSAAPPPAETSTAPSRPADRTAPAWAMLAGGPTRTGQSRLAGPATPALKWQLQLGGTVYASPVIASDGTIYIGATDGKFYAIGADGETKWVFKTDGRIVGSAAIARDGTIYFGSADGRFYALNRDGTAKWSFKTKGPIESSPLLKQDGTIYVGSNDHNLYAINPNGEAKWVFATRREITASPALDSDGNLYIGSHDRSLYLLSPRGKEIWRHNIKGEINQHITVSATTGMLYVPWIYQVKTTGGMVPGSVIFDESPEFRPTWPRILALRSDNTWLWAFETKHVLGTPVSLGDNGDLYFGSWDKTLYAVLPDGSRSWTFKASGEFSSPITVGSDGVVYAGNRNNRLYAIDANGAKQWSYKMNGALIGAPAIGFDRTLFVATREGNLYALGQSE